MKENAIYTLQAGEKLSKAKFLEYFEKKVRRTIRTNNLVDKKENIFGLTTYGGLEFCSIIKHGNIYGCQFHPEKSQTKGLKLLRNFLNFVEESSC